MVASSDLRRSEHRLLRQREGADGNTDRLLPDREHHRELAGEMRRVAQLARSPFAREELIRLATSFEYRASRQLGRY
jgi:hypothetical protein